MSYWLSLLSIITLFSYLYIWSAIYGDGLCFEYSFGIMWWIGSSISFYLFYEEQINGSVELICCFVSFYFIGSFMCSGYNACIIIFAEVPKNSLIWSLYFVVMKCEMVSLIPKWKQKRIFENSLNVFFLLNISKSFLNNQLLSSITTSLLSILFLSYNWLLSFSTLSFMFLDILSIAFAASITFYIFPAASLNILKSSSVGSFL
jgi:hypothetical protein